jgi:hypothetical protein
MAITNSTQQRLTCTTSTTKRRTISWLPRIKKADKATSSGDWKLQPPDVRRRYLRRGSKTCRMLRLPPGFRESMKELDESTSTASTFSSDEFTASTTNSENADGQVLTSQDDQHPLSNRSRDGMNLSHVALLTSALAIATIGMADEVEN